MVAPITPTAARAAQINSIPDFVFQAFNDMITKKMAGTSAHILAKDVVAQILVTAEAAGTPTSTDLIYANRWMDVEPVYRKAGWKVDYDRPGYNESYEAHYTFTERKE